MRGLNERHVQERRKRAIGSPTDHGCTVIDDIVEAARSQSPETTVARCPLRPERFVLVPMGWAERVMTAGAVD